MDDPARRADAGEIVGKIEAEPFETRPADGPVDRAAGASLLKPPIRARGDGRGSACRPEERFDGGAILDGAQAFGRLEAKHQIGDILGGHDRSFEGAGGDVDPGEAHRCRSGGVGHVIAVVARGAGRRAGSEGEEPVAAGGIKEGLVGSDAGGDDPGYFSAEEPFGCFRVVDLFADGDAATGGDELDELRIELMVGKPGHRHGVGPLVAAGEREIEEIRSLAGIVAEELVEIPHPKEDQRAGAACLRRFELLHHRTCHGGQVWPMRPSVCQRPSRNGCRGEGVPDDCHGLRSTQGAGKSTGFDQPGVARHNGS